MHQVAKRCPLHVCVDLEAPFAASGAVIDGTESNRTGDWLIQRMGQYGIAATWAVADPVHSAVTARLLAGRIEHELAVLGDRTWVGPAAGRRRFSAELTRRVLRARAEGLAVTTLATRDPVASDHLDLLVRHGITALRSPATASTSDRGVEQIRFGVWQFTAQTSLPNCQGWFGATAFRGIARQLARRQGSGRCLLVRIDAPALSLRGPRARRGVERLLSRIARWSRDGQVRIETMAAAARRLSAARRPEPARSILRKAG